MVLFERDVDWRQSAWHDYGAALAEGETGPRRPFSDRAADDHAVRRHLDDARAGQDVGSYPRVVRQCVFAPASDIIGEGRRLFEVLFGRAHWYIEVDKSEALRVVVHSGQH